MSRQTDVYFERFGFCERQILSAPARDLGLVVVIPCFNEPDWIGSLESLRACEEPTCAVEVIVVINSPADCAPEIRARNRRTLEVGRGWAADHAGPGLAFHWLDFPELPAKQAGVGLARKIGMDEAARRFDDVGRPDRVIVCFDADCRCEANYLRSIERHFETQPGSPACSISFEHPLAGPLDPRVYEAVAAYELHLRYYVQALRYAGFPYAFHTVGSSMAVRSDAYLKQGGMNKRQAGEDFYFLQKIFPLGGFTELNETTVFPSPRESDRVPFGTGRAVSEQLNGREQKSYPLEAFQDMRAFLERVPELWQNSSGSTKWPAGLPESIQTFLKAQEFGEALREIAVNTSSAAAFRKRFFRWFDGFQAMKFVHHARDHFHGDRDVTEEAGELMALRNGTRLRGHLRTVDLLKIYREIDRRGWSETGEG